jgi:hypothetical protein
MKVRRRANHKPSHQVWAEENKKGGYIIFCGVKGTEQRTIAGGAANLETLDYNLRKARHKFGLKI